MTNFKIISKKEYEMNNEEPNQKEVWNAIAKPWKTYVVKKIQVVENFLKEKKGKILDLGCGTGRNMIPNEDIEYYGVDFSSEQLKQAERYIEENKVNVKLVESNANNLSVFNDEFFDYGLFIASLHCIETKEKRLQALKEFYRVLKNGGEGLISVWNSNDKRFNQVGNNGEIYLSWYENNVPYMRYYYLYNKDELRSLIKSVGFVIIKFLDVSDDDYDRFSKKNFIIKVKK